MRSNHSLFWFAGIVSASLVLIVYSMSFAQGPGVGDCTNAQGQFVTRVDVLESQCALQGYCLPIGPGCHTAPLGAPGGNFYKVITGKQRGTCAAGENTCSYCPGLFVCMTVEWYQDAACSILISTAQITEAGNKCFN